MARNARPTAAKRFREKTLIDRRQQKETRRREAKDKKEETEGIRTDGIDPDIADIVPGPQPLADWQIEDEVEAVGEGEPAEAK